MRRLLVSLVGLFVCTAFALGSPKSAQARGTERVQCEECIYGGGEYCAGTGQPDWQFCGAGAVYCEGEGWNVTCLWAEEDFECEDPCAYT